MPPERIHHATSLDGTRLSGRAVGQGPPLVLVYGIFCDSEIWTAIVPHLAKHFTCYLMDLRGRGLSEGSPNLSSRHNLEDVLAIVESIDEPVGLVGHSLGGRRALQVTAQCDRVLAVAVYEPALREVLQQEGSPDLGTAFRETVRTSHHPR